MFQRIEFMSVRNKRDECRIETGLCMLSAECRNFVFERVKWNLIQHKNFNSKRVLVSMGRCRTDTMSFLLLLTLLLCASWQIIVCLFSNEKRRRFGRKLIAWFQCESSILIIENGLSKYYKCEWAEYTLSLSSNKCDVNWMCSV